MTVRLRVGGLTVRLKPLAAPLAEDVALVLESGRVIGICGRSGSGKSTLLACLSGLVPWARAGQVSGTVILDGEEIADLDPSQRAPHLATCLDRPESQLFLSTPRHELAAARSLHSPAPLADAVVDCLGVGPLLDRRTVGLSSGERQRVALAVSLGASPCPVLLDEPCAHLDDDGVRGLVEALMLVREHGGAVIVVEQAGWRLGAAVTDWLELRDGRLAPARSPARPALAAAAHRPGATVLAVRSLSLSRGGRELLRAVDLHLHAGEIVLLSGANASGKSSLARVLAGHAVSAGISVGRGCRWPRRPAFVSLAMPDAGLQLFASTVAGELGLAGTALADAGEHLRRHRLETLVARAPWTLSRGERQRLLHAALDALAPDVMVIDEPGQGLDPGDIEDLAGVIRERAAAGRAYLLLSHRLEFANLAHRQLRIAGGRIVEVAGSS